MFQTSVLHDVVLKQSFRYFVNAIISIFDQLLRGSFDVSMFYLSIVCGCLFPSTQPNSLNHAYSETVVCALGKGLGCRYQDCRNYAFKIGR